MKNSQKGSTIINSVIIVVIATLLFGAVYYLFIKSQKSDLLSQAETKVKIETKKLENLNSRYSKERATIKQIQDQYMTLRNNVLKNTDRFFDDPEGDNPKFLLKINDKVLEGDINKRRLAITKLLKDWDKKMADIDSDKINQNSLPTLLAIINEAKSGIDYVNQYVNQLGNVISQLSPNSSALQQTEIYVYENIIEESRSQVNQIVSNITSIQVAVQTTIQTANSSTTVASVSTTSSTGGTQTSSSNPTQTVATVQQPIVTQTQIQTQAQILAQAQQQLAQIQQGITALASSTPTVSTATTSTPTQVYIPYSYYPSYQMSGAQTIIEYLQSLPSPNIDRTGWADATIDTSSSDPLLLDGSN